MRIITIIVPLMILLIALVQGSTLVWRLFALSVFAIGLSYLWIYRAGRGLTGKLKNHGLRYQAGHPIDIESMVESSGLLPKPFVKMQVVSKLPMANNNTLISLPSQGSHYWHCQVLQPQRGRYGVGPLIAELSDPFGLLRVRKKLDGEQEILVYPRTVDLSSFWVSANASSGIGENSWFNRGSGNIIFGIREYVPGDSLNRIHWRSTAHTGQLVVKEFDSDLAKKVWVILDLDRETQAGKGAESTEEYGVTIAASILKKYAESGCHVGLVAQPDDYHFFQARPGLPHMWRLQEALAVFKATGKTPLNRVIDRLQPSFDGNSVAVIITTTFSAQTVDSIAHIQKKGIPVVLIVLDYRSFGGNRQLSSAGSTKLRAMGIPIYTVKRGDNVSEVLNTQGKGLSLNAREGVY